MKKTQTKYNKILATLVILLPLIALFSCHDHHDDPIPNPEPEPEPEQPLPHRTLLVYMVAANNLGTSGYDMLDTREMRTAAKAGDLQGGRLLIYNAPNNYEPVLLEITNDGGIDTLAYFDKSVVSVSIEQMREVITKTKELAPAQEYGMVLWSHANGWVQDGVSDVLDDKINYSFGKEGADKMNITALASALTNQDMKFLYFDCCYMGNVESIYELRECADYIVASPTEDPITGMPYDLTIKHLFAQPLDMIGAAKTTNEYYSDINNNTYQCPITYSVYQTDKIAKLASMTKAIYGQYGYIWPEGYEPQRFGASGYAEYHYFFDLAHFIKNLCSDENLLNEWLEALNDVVLYTDNNGTVWGDYPIDECCGLSTYILKSTSNITTGNYYTLNWYQNVIK